MGRIEVHQQHAFCVVVFVFEFYVLVQRPLRPVGLIATVYRANVMPRYLGRSPTHPLLTLAFILSPRSIGTLIHPPPLPHFDP